MLRWADDPNRNHRHNHSQARLVRRRACQAVADIVDELDEPPATPLRPLSDREAALLAQSKADFAAGRSYSMAEVIAHLDAALAPLGVPPYKS